MIHCQASVHASVYRSDLLTLSTIAYTGILKLGYILSSLMMPGKHKE